MTITKDCLGDSELICVLHLVYTVKSLSYYGNVLYLHSVFHLNGFQSASYDASCTAYINLIHYVNTAISVVIYSSYLSPYSKGYAQF